MEVLEFKANVVDGVGTAGQRAVVVEGVGPGEVISFSGIFVAARMVLVIASEVEVEMAFANGTDTDDKAIGEGCKMKGRLLSSLRLKSRHFRHFTVFVRIILTFPPERVT